MPLKPIDYSKTIFYRIVCNDLNIKDCYIGHTTNFINRKRLHKLSCNNEKCNFKIYQFIRENGGWDNWSMVMIEQISCENFNEACKLERNFLEEYNGTLNNNIPSRTQKEYCEKNKDKINENHKKYYEENKDKLKEYYEENKEKIKEKQKEYREKNKEKIKEIQKNYRKNNDKKEKERQKKYREKNKKQENLII